MRLIDADKLHYKKVYIQDANTLKIKPAVVVFAKEIDKAVTYKPDNMDKFNSQVKDKYVLTERGICVIENFIAECKAKRKEILDAGIDTADLTSLPTAEDILSDLNDGIGIDEDGDYYNCWGVTDNYNSDNPLCLEVGIDFMCTTFEALHEVFGFGDMGKTRQELTKHQERKFVNNCFFIYENTGFTETFYNPYMSDTYKARNGEKFSVVGRCNDADLETLPAWMIRFQDGNVICAYPEEICLVERE